MQVSGFSFDFWFTLLFGAIFLLVGTGMVLFGGLPTVRDAYASADWPTVEGTIVESRVDRSRSIRQGGSLSKGSHRRTFSAHVVYRYTVDGVPIDGENVAFGQHSSSSHTKMQQIANRYPAGKTVLVAYKPDDPFVAVLEPGATHESYFLLWFGGIFAVAGLGILAIPATIYWKQRAHAVDLTRGGGET